MPLTDEQLIKEFRAGNACAADELLERYKHTVRSTAHRFFLSDGDREDLVQEGMHGLYSAIISFEGDRGFSSYAYTCIKNRMLDAVKKSCGLNAGANAEALPFMEDECAGSGFSPEEALIDSESVNEVWGEIKGILSPLEYRAIKMYTDGATMTEIAKALNRTYKQTDNAIFRAKHKLRPLFGK